MKGWRAYAFPWPVRSKFEWQGRRGREGGGKQGGRSHSHGWIEGWMDAKALLLHMNLFEFFPSPLLSHINNPCGSFNFSYKV